MKPAFLFFLAKRRKWEYLHLVILLYQEKEKTPVELDRLETKNDKRKRKTIMMRGTIRKENVICG